MRTLTLLNFTHNSQSVAGDGGELQPLVSDGVVSLVKSLNKNGFSTTNFPSLKLLLQVMKKGLILIVLLLCILNASAQVSTLTAWSNLYNNNADLSGGLVTIPAGSGTYRVLVVAVASSQSGVGARTAVVTYGTQTLTLAAGDMASATIRQHTALYYLDEAGIDAAGSSPTLNVTFSGGTARVNTVWYSVYDFVDQSTPIRDFKNYNNNNNQGTTCAFAPALTVNYDDQAIEVIGTLRSNNTAWRSIGASTNWTSNDERTFAATDGIRNGVFTRSISATNTTDVSSHTISGNSLTSMTGISLRSVAKQFRSNITTGTWGSLATWQQSMDGGTSWVAATTVPANTDGLVTILNGHTITLSAPSTASSLTINSGGTLNTSGTLTNTLSVSGVTTIGGTLTLANTGAKTFNGDVIINGTWNETDIAAINFGGNLTNNATTFTTNSGTHTFSGATKTLGGGTTTSIANISISGSYTNNASLAASTSLGGAGTLANGATGTINIGGTISIGTLSLTEPGNTVNYNGTGTQTIPAFNYYNLTSSSTGTRTLASSGTIGVAGTFTTGTNTYTTTGSTIDFNGSGAQTIPDFAYNNLSCSGSGTKSLSAASTITGEMAISGTAIVDLGSFTSTAISLSFGGNLQSDGTHGSSGSSATYTNDTYFAPASTGILRVGLVTSTWTGATADWNTPSNWSPSGVPTAANNVVIPSGTPFQPAIATTGLCRDLTVNSGASLTITGTVTVSGTWTNNGTVIYDGVAQTIDPVTFNNLTLAGTGGKTFPTGTTTVNGVLSIENGAYANTFTGTLTYGANATLQYNTSSARTTSTEFPGIFTASGGVIIANTGTITLGGNKIFNTSVPLIINQNATLNPGNRTISYGGDFINNGTMVSSTAAVSFSGTADQNIGSFTIVTAGITMGTTKTAGTVTFTGNVSAGGLTINGTGGTLNLGTGLTHTFTAAIALTSGTLNGGSSTLNANGATTSCWNGTGTNFIAGSGTVVFGRAGTQTLNAASTFNNLTFAGTSTKTLTGVPTVNGVLSMEGTTAAVSAAPTYGANATLQYNKTTAFTSGAEWITPFVATGGVVIGGSGGAITTNAAKLSAVPLSIQTGAVLNLGTFTTHTCGNLTLGGTGQVSGTWGSSSSIAAHPNNTFFAATSGYLTVGSSNLIWTGGTSTDWNTPSNWNGGSVPTSADNVIILSGTTYQPNIGVANGTCKSITELSGVTISGTGTLTIANSMAIADVSGPSTISCRLVLPSTATITNNSDLIISGVVSGAATRLTKTGSGVLSLSGLNTYSGQTLISQGTLSVNTLANSGFNSSLGTGSTTPAISMAASTTLQYTGTDHSTSRSITLTGSNVTIDAGAGTLTLSGGVTGNTFGLVLTGTGTATESGIINTSTGTLKKDGSGTWTLSGANTYSGATNISAGTLKLGSNTALGTSSATIIGTDAVLDLNGITLSTARPLTINGTGISGSGALINSNATQATYSGAITFSSAGSIVGEAGLIAITGTPASGAQAITLGGSAGGSISTVIAGDRTLTKEGTGTWTLSGANSYTGATTITQGEMRLNPAANTTSVSQVVLNGGILSTTGISSSRTITSSSTLKLDNNSTIALGANTHTLTFANSTAIPWNGTSLSITGWTGVAGTSGTAGKIFFGNTTGTLTSTQLSKIKFNGYLGIPILLSTGELVPTANPDLSISGSPIDFGSSCVGTAAVPVTYTISNTGATAAGVTVTSDNPDFIVSNAPTTVLGDGTATFIVTFTPSSGGAKSATITVSSTTPGSNSPTISLTGTGTNVTATPVITTVQLCAGTTTISGTCESGADIVVYANASSIGTVTASGTFWTVTVFPAFVAPNVITATATSLGKCVSSASSSKTVQSVTAVPIITTSTICSGTTSISGTSEDGAIINVYAGAALIGTGTASGTAWTVTVSPAFITSDVITATASGKCVSGASNGITVDPASIGGTIAASPSTTVCPGSNSTLLTLSGYVGNITKWQSSTNNWLTTVDIANTAPTFTALNLTFTTKYRAVITRGSCASANSTELTISVTASVGGSVTGGTTICAGSTSGLLTLSGETGSVTKWQSSTNNWVTPVDITHTGTTYTSGALTQTTQFRAVVQSGTCSVAYSAATTVIVNPATVGGAVNGGSTVCAGNNSGLLTLSGHTGTITKWQSSIDNWVSSLDISNTGATYTSSALTQTTQFRAVVQSGTCAVENSTPTTVTVSSATTWTGTVGTDWSNPGNWSCNLVPTSSSDVTIPNVTNYPVISASAFCRNITINSGSSLTISGTNTLTVSGNWNNNGGTFTRNTSTVIFNSATQTITGSTTFNNATIKGTGAKTITTADFIVNGVLSMEETGTLASAPTYGSVATLQFNTVTSRTAGAEWITPFTATGGVIIANSGTITLGSAKIFNASVPLTINSSSTLNTGNFQITFGGNFVNSGAFVAGSSPIDIANTMVAQSISGFTTTGLVSMTKTAGVATFTSNVSGGDLTINGAGGTLNLGAGLTHTFSGTWTRTNGTLNGGSSTLNFTKTGVVDSGTGGTFTASTGTVNYSINGAQTIAAVTYNNLILSGGNTKTFSAATTIGANLSIATGTIANLATGLSHSANSLTLGGVGQATGTWGATISTAAYKNDTYFTSTTGIITVNATPIAPPTAISANPSTINSGTSGTITLTASGGGDGGTAILKWYATGCGSGSSIGTGPSIGISFPVSTTTYYARWENGGNFSTCLNTTVTVVKTFYSYQSGNWNNANTWTTDPSGSNWVNDGIPTAVDNVVILNGRTITVSESGKVILSMELRLGGTLDLQNTNSHNFGTVTGEGVLKLASGTFPGGTYTGFVSNSGGTVEYYDLNGQSISSTQLTYNKLVISNYSASDYTTYLNNAVNNITYTINGTFDLKKFGTGSLTFYFGNPTPSDNLINMTVAGNFTVASGCNFRVNNFSTAHTLASSDVSTSIINPVHTLTLYGDFTNNGSVRFTGLPSPFNDAYYLLATTAFGGTNYGDVQVFFAGATNNTVTCNGTTDFFRFIVEKGTDQTYTLEVNSSGTGNFGLFGPNNQGNSNFAGYGYYYKALFLHYGTLKLNSNINIPSISEGGQDFLLNPSACLWVNGANVSTTVSGLNGTGYQAATFYGKIRISAGQFSTADAAGIVLGDISTPEVEIEGTGILDVSQVWNNTGATNLISYTQTGGSANFRLMGENHAGAVFSLDNTNAVFNMSGGAINFTDNTFSGGGTDFRLFNILVPSGKYAVTGGTINVNVPASATVYTGNSTVPFYNMTLTNKTGTGTVTLQIQTPGPNLSVLNDLSIGNGTILDMNTNTIGLNVGRNFTLSSFATYTPGANTTTFNGSGAQIFTNTGTITSGLNNISLSNTSNTSITNDLTVRGLMTIGAGTTLNDQGFTISTTGNISNSGTHTSQANGSILLNSTSAQTIAGSGSGIFGNLGINKISGTTTFQANQSIEGNLRLVSGILDIVTFNLKFGASSDIYDELTGTATPSTFGVTKMIKTAGGQGDGGVTKTFNAIGSFSYPFGAATYHPAIIAFSEAPSHWGDVTVKPVAVNHPSAVPATSMKYYWKVTSNSITGILPGSVSHTYYYLPADISGTETAYITGAYRPFAWVKGDGLQVDKINKKIHFPAIQYLDGEYTAGETTSFGDPKVFYSIASGDWGSNSTWSNISHTGAAVASPPTASDLVVIGDGSNHFDVVTISSGSKTVSGLQINSGSTLDVNTTTGHVFGPVTGTGKLRISSSTATAVFPSGDFANFLGSSGGTVDYYTETAPGNIGIAFTLPTTYLVGSNPVNIVNYYNLILSPATGKNITMPNTNLLIYNNLDVSKSGTSVTGISQMNNQAISRTVTINGNLNVNFGNLQYTNLNSTAQNLVVLGDVIVATGATFNVAATLAATNTLSIQGNLTNNGTFDMLAGAAQICNVTFTGAANNTISGTATLTEFNTLTVNKGIDKTSVLEVTVSAMTLNTALASAMTLTNGTFKLSSALTLGLTLTTSSQFTIPATACLSANIGTIHIGTANNNAADLMLQGRLEVIGASGIVNIGGAQVSNNDIEYAASGNPEIFISAGALNVNGQIRRNLANTSGSLIYTQSGGTVTIKGNSFEATRGMFEVLNTGSQFNITDGNLVIVNPGSTYADLHLEPASYIVNAGIGGGHTVTFGNTNTPAAQVFKLNSTSPLYNLTVDGTTTSKTASLSINALSVLNNLTINSAGSVFKANDLNVTIGGSLINNNTTNTTGCNVGGYQTDTAAASTQTTTFTGNGTITGVGTNLTNFANLVIGSMSSTPSITLGTTSNIRVNTNLTLTSGTLSDAGNTITAMGNINNSATHYSSSSSGGILLANNSKQTVTTTGSGQFGNVTVDNTSGVDVIGDSWINGQLTLTAGSLYINFYKLVMNTGATFGGTYDAARMIILNGANSDKGVMKNFTASAAGFVFPIGTPGKYRPVTLTFTATDAGSITIVPVNSAHPADDALSTTDQLNYYWKNTVAGFSGGVSNVTQVYQYGAIEVTGTESEYVGARYSNSSWTKYVIPNPINSTNHTITVNDLISGDYTAGAGVNFGDVYSLYSLGNGNWNNTSIWSVSPTDLNPCTCYPQGNPVFIKTGHTITMNINSATASSVDIKGTFDLKQSAFHSLGTITGNGKLMLEGTVDQMFLFPGGNYDAFMATTNSTVELYGAIDSQMPLDPGNIAKPYQNLIISGTGIKKMSAQTLKILGNLTINAGATLSDVLFNKELYILGDWTDHNTTPSSGGFIPGTGNVSFEGSTAQTLTVSSGSVTESFYNLGITNSAGLTLSGKAQVSNILTLNNGAITTTSANSLTLTNASTTAVSGGSVSSYINGPLRKQISNGSFFNFPVGKKTPSPRYGQVYLSGVVTAGIWEAEYFNQSPPYSTSSMLAPVVSVSGNEYWRIQGVNSGSAYAKLRWDTGSGLSADPIDRAKARVVEWNPSSSLWENRGNVVTDISQTEGYVETANAISLAPGADLHYLTIGSGSLPLPTATITSPLTASICNNGIASTTISVSLTGAAPWSLSYQLGAVTTTLSNIAASPVSIVLTSNSSGITQPIAGSTNFNFRITNVNDLNGASGVTDYTTLVVLTVNPQPDNTITGKTLVGTGEIVAYTTPADANLYAWTLSSNGTYPSANTSTFTVTWGTGNPGPYTIGLTKTTSAGCVSTNSISVTTSTSPTPVIIGKQKVCTGSTETYSTSFVSGHSYTWTKTGNGTINTTPDPNIITVTWGIVSINNTVKVREYVTATPTVFTEATKVVDIGIQPSASIPVFVAPAAPVCVGVGPTFTINNSQLNVRYQLKNSADNSNSGLFVDGTGGSITLTGSPIVNNTTYYIYAYALDPFDCFTTLSNPTSTATVTAIPWGSWLGTSDVQWNNAANWTCGQIPGITTNVVVPSSPPNSPVLSSGSTGMANNLTINSSASLTVTGNTLQIAGNITSPTGMITALTGTIEMKGSSPQTIPSGTFASNLVANLIVNNSAGVTLLGPVGVTEIVKVTSGNIASNGHLTLKSTASQTALIDGSGAGSVSGDVTMERYLSSAYGYKYLSSPFASASLTATLSGNATIPTFYAYNENNSAIVNSVLTYISGWVSTPVTGLSPMAGYAANFGQAVGAQTFSMTGTVNNGSMSVTLYNHNRTYTQGFNLVGNPYPSPIDWNSTSWSNSNIGASIYFFSANGDQYSGTYSSYVKGVGLGSNIIPAMQGFFVHVNDGTTGTLGFNNSIRTTDLNWAYKSANVDNRTILNFGISFDQKDALTDPFLIYFDNMATMNFDNDFDALKLMNTNVNVPNLYEIVSTTKKLAISGMPEPNDSLTRIPIGINALKDGWINISATDLSKLPSEYTIYLEDKSNNIRQDLRRTPTYRFYASSGETNNRFNLILSLVNDNYGTIDPEKLFTLSKMNETLQVRSNLFPGDVGELRITNMTGQTLFRKTITSNQTIDFGAEWESGIYVVTLVSGNNSYSEKTIIRK